MEPNQILDSRTDGMVELLNSRVAILLKMCILNDKHTPSTEYLSFNSTLDGCLQMTTVPFETSPSGNGVPPGIRESIDIFSKYLLLYHVIDSLPDNVTFTFVNHISVVCGTLLTFFTGLPP